MAAPPCLSKPVPLQFSSPRSPEPRECSDVSSSHPRQQLQCQEHPPVEPTAPGTQGQSWGDTTRPAPGPSRAQPPLGSGWSLALTQPPGPRARGAPAPCSSSPGPRHLLHSGLWLCVRGIYGLRVAFAEAAARGKVVGTGFGAKGTWAVVSARRRCATPGQCWCRAGTQRPPGPFG